MSDMNGEFIDEVRNANEVFLDAEARAHRWARQRSKMTQLAHQGGVSIEEIAAGVKQPLATVREWLEAPSD